MAHNNNIVEFYSDTVGKVPLKANIYGFGQTINIYPSPTGLFWFNWMEYFRMAVNTNRFNDPVQMEISGGVPSTWTYNAVLGCYTSSGITYEIEFTDNTTESISSSANILNGVYQIEQWKRDEILANSVLTPLTPCLSRQQNQAYLVYWKGLPFEISFYMENPKLPVTIRNERSGITAVYTPKNFVTAFAISDGSADITTEDILPLFDGVNRLTFSVNGTVQATVVLVQIPDNDGIYFKYLNRYGRFNYWKFECRHYRTRTQRKGAEVGNDFNNLIDTTAPMLLVNKAADQSIKIAALRTTEQDRIIINEMIDSPKILMYTGEPFSLPSANDWVEVQLKTNSIQVTDPKRDIFNVVLEMDLPNRYTQTL